MLAKGKAPKVFTAKAQGRSRLQTFPRGDGPQGPRNKARKGEGECMNLPLSSAQEAVQEAQTAVPAKQQKRKLGFRVLTENDKLVIFAMSVEEWINVKDHPRQRDTKRHARATHWKEAKFAEGATKTHLAHVTGAILNGQLYKVDGHTRAYLWQKGELPVPQEVIVTAYKVKSYEELLDLYCAIDVSSAGETWTDKVCGAFHENGYVLKSAGLRHASLANALHIALRAVPIGYRKSTLRQFDAYKAINIFLPEIVKIDQLSPPADIARVPGIMGAALILITLYPNEVQEFFRRLFAKQGEKRKGRSDPVEATLALIEDYKVFKPKVPALHVDVCGRCIRAASYFIEAQEKGVEKVENYWLKNKLHYLDILPFVKEVRQKKVPPELEEFL
jgi:hypothetical protein